MIRDLRDERRIPCPERIPLAGDPSRRDNEKACFGNQGFGRRYVNKVILTQVPVSEENDGAGKLFLPLFLIFPVMRTAGMAVFGMRALVVSVKKRRMQTGTYAGERKQADQTDKSESEKCYEVFQSKESRLAYRNVLAIRKS
jgi:hypothetical protein